MRKKPDTGAALKRVAAEARTDTAEVAGEVMMRGAPPPRALGALIAAHSNQRATTLPRAQGGH